MTKEETVSKTGTTMESQIHVFRAMKRMTQQELADKVGCSRQTIIQLERNRYNPSLLLAHDIAEVFEVPIEAIITFKVKEVPSEEIVTVNVKKKEEVHWYAKKDQQDGHPS